tara:strand:+ start:1668 stop:2132 length:465 start_codon:yes stop_codon:yes gene_type:complete
MFIECPNCNKKFDVDQNLIPESGRLVQCGSCQNTWLYQKILKKEIKDIQVLKEKKITEKKINKNIHLKTDNKVNQNISSEKKYEIVKKEAKIKKKGLNYFKFLLVILISFVALIVVLDTFKVYISEIFPKINDLLNNLYNTLIDIFLFLKDLVK